MRSFFLLSKKIIKFPKVLISLLQKKETLVLTRDGHKLYCRDLMELWTVKETILEDVYHIKEFIKYHSIETVVDIGGAFGDFDVFTQKLSPKSKCFVFEPQEKSCKQILKNLSLNKINLSQVEVSNTAASNSVYEENYKRKISTNGLKNGEMIFLESEKGTIEVSFSNFNIFLDKLNANVDILKIDCEGGEYNILPSINLNQLKKIKFITMEWHEFHPKQDHKIIFSHLKQNNFDVISIKSPVHNEIGYLYAKNKLFNWQ